MSNTTRCESCGKPAASHDIVHFGAQGKYEILCGGCFNRKAAAMMGVDYKHADFRPVTVTDCLGKPHEFHFRSHLVATGLVIDAFELEEGVPSGYEFSVLGEPDQQPLDLFRRLYERIRHALSVKHLERTAEGWSIGETDSVAGHITWDDETDGRLPGLVIDGESIRWEELGRMLTSYEGFHFRLDIHERTEEH
jgi:hypothetical protein